VTTITVIFRALVIMRAFLVNRGTSMKSIIKALKEKPALTIYKLAIYPVFIIMLFLTSCLVAAFNLSAKDGIVFFNEAL
jgi:hypothetical protein